LELDIAIDAEIYIYRYRGGGRPEVIPFRPAPIKRYARKIYIYIWTYIYRCRN